MTRSGFYRDPRWAPEDVAVGYGPLRYGKENSPRYWPTNAWPVAGNGGMAGPLMDLYRAFDFIDQRRSTSERFDEIWRSSHPEDAPRDIYGSAGGNDFGFVTVFYYDPVARNALVLSSNADQDGGEDAELVMGLIEVAFDRRLGEGRSEDGPGAAPPDEHAATAAIVSPPRAWGMPDRATWRRGSAVVEAIASDDPAYIKTLVTDSLQTPSPPASGLRCLCRDIRPSSRTCTR